MENTDKYLQFISETIKCGEIFKIGIDYDLLVEHVNGSNYSVNCLEWLEILRTALALYSNIKIDVLSYHSTIFMINSNNVRNNIERYGLLINNVVRKGFFNEKEDVDLIINNDTCNLEELKVCFKSLIKNQKWFSLQITEKQIAYIKGLCKSGDPMFTQCVHYYTKQFPESRKYAWDSNELLKKLTRLDARIIITFGEIKIKRDKVRYSIEREKEKEERDKEIAVRRNRLRSRGYGDIDDCDFLWC